jgi:hypothetical protein
LFLHEQQDPEQHPLNTPATNNRIIQFAAVFTTSAPAPSGVHRDSERTFVAGIHSGQPPLLINNYRHSATDGTLSPACPICPSLRCLCRIVATPASIGEVPDQHACHIDTGATFPKQTNISITRRYIHLDDRELADDQEVVE